jgi:hypothetical protein
MSERIANFEQVFDDLIRQHADDKDGGYSEYEDIVGWLRVAALEDQQNIRAVLLDHLGRRVPRSWAIALEVLADDAAPGVPAQLEAMARSTGERSQWRDGIIVKLARLGHRPALDLCLDGLQAGQQFQADRTVLLANLIRLEPEVALDSAVSYFVAEADSSEQRRDTAERWSRVFFSVYSSVNPDYPVELVRRTMRVSPSASELLIFGLSTWCKDLLARPGFPDEKTVRAIFGKVQELEQKLTNSYLHELSLSITGPSEMRVGGTQTFGVAAKDGTAAPIGGLVVRLHVAGANPQIVESTTDSDGCAVLRYTGTHPGLDRVHASAVAHGPAVLSNTGKTLWLNAMPDGEIEEAAGQSGH